MNYNHEKNQEANLFEFLKYLYNDQTKINKKIHTSKIGLIINKNHRKTDKNEQIKYKY